MYEKSNKILYDKNKDEILSIGNIRMRLDFETSKLMGKNSVELLTLRYKSGEIKNDEQAINEIVLGELKDLNQKDKTSYIEWLRTISKDDKKSINESINNIRNGDHVTDSQNNINSTLNGIGTKMSDFFNLTEEGYDLLVNPLSKSDTFNHNATVSRSDDLSHLKFLGLSLKDSRKDMYSEYFKTEKEWEEHTYSKKFIKDDFRDGLKKAVNGGTYSTDYKQYGNYRKKEYNER